MAKYFRVRYHVRSNRASWGYNFYLQDESAKAAVTTAKATDIILPFITLHHRQTVIQRISAALVEDTVLPAGQRARQTFSEAVSYAGVGNLVEGMPLPEGPDSYNTTIYLGLRTDTGAQRKLHLSGIPDGYTVWDRVNGRFAPAPAVMALLGDIVTAIRGRNYRLRVRQPETAAGFEWHGVQSLAATLDTGGVNTTVTTYLPVDVEPGDRVVFSLRDDCEVSGMTGSHRVLDVTANEIVVNVKYRSKLDSLTPVGMRVRKEGWDYPLITDGGFDRARGRDRGGSLDAPRGRQKSKSCRK